MHVSLMPRTTEPFCAARLAWYLSELKNFEERPLDAGTPARTACRVAHPAIEDARRAGGQGPQSPSCLSRPLLNAPRMDCSSPFCSVRRGWAASVGQAGQACLGLRIKPAPGTLQGCEHARLEFDIPPLEARSRSPIYHPARW